MLVAGGEGVLTFPHLFSQDKNARELQEQT
jgi:hypothetical protein